MFRRDVRQMAADFGFIPNEQPGSYFISYNSEDADRVAPIARQLHESGVPVWYDQGLIPGYEWEYQIAKQIEKCSCVILFATKKLFQREKSYVRTEYYIAREKYDKRVIVVLLDKINAKDVDEHNIGWWFEINRLHCIANADARKIMTAIGFTKKAARRCLPSRQRKITKSAKTTIMDATASHRITPLR